MFERLRLAASFLTLLILTIGTEVTATPIITIVVAGDYGPGGPTGAYAIIDQDGCFQTPSGYPCNFGDFNNAAGSILFDMAAVTSGTALISGPPPGTTGGSITLTGPQLSPIPIPITVPSPPKIDPTKDMWVLSPGGGRTDITFLATEPDTGGMNNVTAGKASLFGGVYFTGPGVVEVEWTGLDPLGMTTITGRVDWRQNSPGWQLLDPIALTELGFADYANGMGARLKVIFEGAQAALFLPKSADYRIIPEPTTLSLMGLGLAGIGYRRNSSKKSRVKSGCRPSTPPRLGGFFCAQR